MPKFVSHSFLDHIAPAGGVGQLVPIDRVTSNPDQPRKRYRQDELEALASSIRAHGLINPITVDEHYRIIAGERRWQACKIAGLTEIPVIVRERNYEVSLVENLQRRDLHPLDEAAGYQRLVELGYTQTQIAERVGKDQSVISKSLSLLKLPQEILDDYETMHTVSRDLLLQVVNEPTPERQLALWKRIQQEQLSARALKREKRQEPSVTPRMFIRSVQALHQRVERLDVRQLKPKDRDRLRTHIEQTISRLSTVLKKLDGKRTSDSH